MLKPTRIFTIIAVLLSPAVIPVAAQPAVKVATVDLNRAYSQYWKTQEKTGKLIERSNEIQEQINEMQKRIEAVANEVRQLRQDSENPALNSEAKARISSDAQKKFEEFQDLQERLRQYADNMERSIQQDRNIFTKLMIDEITDKVLEIAKARGANVVLDTSGRTANGVSGVLYADPAFDVTEAVITELNKTKPEGFQPPAVPEPAANTP